VVDGDLMRERVRAGLRNAPAKGKKLWTQGRATDLEVVSGVGCSYATSINLLGQVVGDLQNCTTDEDVSSFIWQNGTMYDLNTLIPPGSGLTIFEAFDINDRTMAQTHSPVLRNH
jgi:probable HAF family extracellular repeat protein